MKKNISLLFYMRKMLLMFLLFLSIFTFDNNVFASEERIAMWLECDYQVYDKDKKELNTGKPLVRMGGYDSKGNVKGAYRLINKPSYYREKENPDFTGCWFKDSGDIGKDCEDANTYDNPYSMLSEGKCPKIIRYSYTNNKNLVFAGTTTPKKVVYLDRQYRFAWDEDSNFHAYGYDINGYFVYYKNGKVQETYTDNKKFDKRYKTLIDYGVGGSSGWNSIDKYKENFFKIADMDEVSISILNGIRPAEKGIIFDSGSNSHRLYYEVEMWYKNNGDILKKRTQNMKNILSDNEMVVKKCNELNYAMDNNKHYYFDNVYTANDMLDDLHKVFLQINDFLNIYSNEEFLFDMCINDKKTKSPSASAYNCSVSKLLSNLNYVPDALKNLVIKDIVKYLSDGKGIYMDDAIPTDMSETDQRTLVLSLYKCSAYLDSNNDFFGIDDTVTEAIKEQFAKLAEGEGISFVYDCESLLGKKVVDKINDYLDIIKIFIPILLIFLGTVDFLKAIFSNKDDDMKKNQQKFIKRIFIAILFFISPIFINLILNLANRVWVFISPDSCGLF